jgi:integrase
MFKNQIVRYKIIYDRKNQANKKGKAVVQIEAYQDGNRRLFSTGIYLAPEQWNKKKNECKDPYVSAQIRNVITSLENHEKNTRYYNEGLFILKDFDLLKKKIVIADPEPVKQTFNEFFGSQLKARQKELKWNTYRQQTACLNLLNEFNPSIAFDDLKYKVVDDWNQFMINKGHCGSTSQKRHKIVKAYITKAVKLEILSHNAYDNFNIPKPVVNKIVLLGDEIKLLENLVFTKAQFRFERVRDMFLFSTYTGLRWGDVSSLTRQNLIETTKGLELNITAGKTEKLFTLPLYLMFNGKAQEIAFKHWPGGANEKLFPGIYNAFANKTLKEIAVLAGIKKELHFHASRHTAATIIAQTAGVLTAKDILQHSKLDTTMAYLHLSNAERNKSLKDVKDWY